MKKLLALLLCLCLTLPALPAQAAGQEPPAWAAEAYAALEGRSAFSHWYYLCSGPITRENFTRILVGLLDSTVPAGELEAYPAPEDGYFADVSGGPSSALYRAAGYGIVEGSVDGGGQRRADPSGLLTREQAAKMVCSLLDFFSQKLGRPLAPSGEPAVYADAASISPWALPFTGQIAAYGLMKGDNNGSFAPQAELDWPSAVVLAHRTLELLDGAMAQELDGLVLQSGLDWAGAARFGAGDYSVSRPKTGWSQNYYTIANGDGTVSGLVVGDGEITVERFAPDGSLASSQEIGMELPIFGAFFDSGEHFYLAFGQSNPGLDDSQEVFRVVQYDRDWRRLGAVSVSGKDSYTDEPFRSTVARMAVSGDGETVALYAARKRYDGHQSNITILMDTKPFAIQKVMGQEFPDNHVSHSFGQFVRFDGDKMVTVDHGDAYPRSFVFQDDRRNVDLLTFRGEIGNNVTNAIGSGFEVTDDGYLFLGCSDPQDGEALPWNLFLAYLGRSGVQVQLKWLTDREESISCARLVKLDGDSLLAMWQEGENVHLQPLNGKGELTGEEQILANAYMPPTQPVVMDGAVCWIQTSPLPQYSGKPVLYSFRPEL